MVASSPLRALATVLSLLSLPGLARGEEALSRAAIREDMGAYYASERSTTLTMVSYGALSILAGAALATRNDDLSRGLGGSMIVLGSLADLGGAPTWRR